MIALLVFSDLDLNKFANNYEFDTTKLEFEKSFKKIVEKLSQQIEKEYADKILGTLFKNTTICKDLYSKCI